MALLIAALGALLAAFVNLMTKKNLDYKGSAQGYLVIYFFFSLVTACIVKPQVFSYPLCYPLFAAGAFTGGSMFLLMFFVLKALDVGPPGLTFAFQNASSVLPAFFLFFLFGPSFGFIMSLPIILGLTLVLLGLFWSAYPDSTSYFFNWIRKKQPPPKLSTPVASHKSFKLWLCLAVAAFLCQGINLSIFHWVSLVVNPDIPSHPLVFLKCSKEQEASFMPGIFIVATLLNAGAFIYLQKRWFRFSELLFGTIGGLFNGLVTYSLLLSSQLASPFEKALIFPLFAVSVILFCSLWGQKLYKEKVNWPAIGLCILGVFLGAL